MSSYACRVTHTAATSESDASAGTTRVTGVSAAQQVAATSRPPRMLPPTRRRSAT
jgi:hypothetical protein